MPRLVIVFWILQAWLASIRWPTSDRLLMAGPKTVLYRNLAFSTRLRLLKPESDIHSRRTELPKASGESRVIGDREPQPEETGQRPEEPFGLAEGEAEDHADGQGSLDDQVRSGGLPAGPPSGRSPPGLQRGIGEPDREGAAPLEPGLVISPIWHSITGVGVLGTGPAWDIVSRMTPD